MVTRKTPTLQVHLKRCITEQSLDSYLLASNISNEARLLLIHQFIQRDDVSPFPSNADVENSKPTKDAWG